MTRPQLIITTRARLPQAAGKLDAVNSVRFFYICRAFGHLSQPITWQSRLTQAHTMLNSQETGFTLANNYSKVLNTIQHVSSGKFLVYKHPTNDNVLKRNISQYFKQTLNILNLRASFVQKDVSSIVKQQALTRVTNYGCNQLFLKGSQ